MESDVSESEFAGEDNIMRGSSGSDSGSSTDGSLGNEIGDAAGLAGGSNSSPHGEDAAADSEQSAPRYNTRVAVIEITQIVRPNAYVNITGDHRIKNPKLESLGDLVQQTNGGVLCLEVPVAYLQLQVGMVPREGPSAGAPANGSGLAATTSNSGDLCVANSSPFYHHQLTEIRDALGLNGSEGVQTSFLASSGEKRFFDPLSLSKEPGSLEQIRQFLALGYHRPFGDDDTIGGGPEFEDDADDEADGDLLIGINENGDFVCENPSHAVNSSIRADANPVVSETSSNEGCHGGGDPPAASKSATDADVQKKRLEAFILWAQKHCGGVLGGANGTPGPSPEEILESFFRVFSRIKLDPWHFFHSIQLPKKHSLRRPFCQAFRDAVFIPDVDDMKAVEAYLKTKNLLLSKLLQSDPKWLWKQIRRWIPPPDILYPRVKALFDTFGNLICEKTKLPLFSADARKQAELMLESIRKGHLSDPYNVALYQAVGICKYSKLPIYRY
jgi:hypothetical protein